MNLNPNSMAIPTGDSASKLRQPVAPALTFHRYLPFAAVYLLLNSAGLPQGVFYSTLISPLLFVWLYLRGRRWLTAKFLLCISPFVVAHVMMGIASPLYYLRSLCLMWTVYVTVYALAWALLNTRAIERLFGQLIVLHFWVGVFALAIAPTPLRPLLWHDDSTVIAGTSHLMRLSLLTTEPSVCAELMLPLVVFAAVRLLQDNKRRSLIYLMMISLPFLLTQSFGGIFMALAAIGVSLAVSYRRILLRPKNLAISLGMMGAFAALVLVPSPISQRVLQVMSGGDSSTNSRTIFSFLTAYTVASSKSIWWGVGFGQGKLVDVSDLNIGFTVGIIPNAVAGTFAELGIVGVVVRFAVEFFLFARTRVYRNSFRLAMFMVAFATQLTGSHIMDVQQYLMWCLAFLPIFPWLDGRQPKPAASAQI
jgi:hypothetical protein